MNEHIEQKIVDLRSQSLPQRQIAKKIGKSSATVFRVLKREDIKAKIELCKADIVNRAYAKSVDNIVNAIQNYDKPIISVLTDKDGVVTATSEKEGLMRREHGFKASLRVAESIGVIESRSQPSFVQQVLIQNTNNIISPVIDRALGQAIAGECDTIYSEDEE